MNVRLLWSARIVRILSTVPNSLLFEPWSQRLACIYPCPKVFSQGRADFCQNSLIATGKLRPLRVILRSSCTGCGSNADTVDSGDYLDIPLQRLVLSPGLRNL